MSGSEGLTPEKPGADDLAQPSGAVYSGFSTADVSDSADVGIHPGSHGVSPAQGGLDAAGVSSGSSSIREAATPPQTKTSGAGAPPDLRDTPLTTGQSLVREGDKDKNGLLDYGVTLAPWVVPALLLLGVVGLIGGGLLLSASGLLPGFPGTRATGGAPAPTATTQAVLAATVTSVPVPTDTPVAPPTNTLPPQPTNTPVPPPPLLSVTPSQASAFCLNNSYPSITVKNTGGQTLNWSASGPSSPPVTPSPASASLAPGATQTVTVSGSHPGPTVVIQFTGNGGSTTVTFLCK
jgi:hypothetical protein